MENMTVDKIVLLGAALDYIKSGPASLNEVAMIAKQSEALEMGNVFVDKFLKLVAASVAKEDKPMITS